jgi:PAP2 superfamily/Glycerophosphoryl diester phosphodiesterase family
LPRRKALGLFREHAVQSAIIGNETVTDAFNAYYGGTHFLIPALVFAPGGSGHLESVPIRTAGDKYASMPSLHMAWAVWCALALYPVLRHRALRALAVAYPLMTTLVGSPGTPARIVNVTTNQVKISAHAGAKNSTMETCRQAVAAKADYIELDIRRTADKELVASMTRVPAMGGRCRP